MLAEKDVRAYQEGVQEIFDTLGCYLQFYGEKPEREQNTNIYGEYVPSDEEEMTPEFISLICKPTFELSDHLDRYKQRRGSNDDVLFEIPKLELQKYDLSLDDLDKGRVEFDGRMYEVLFIQPKTTFANTVITYSMSCRGMKVI